MRCWHSGSFTPLQEPLCINRQYPITQVRLRSLAVIFAQSPNQTASCSSPVNY
ncbi:hypothetical protein PGT21_002680 [Puccinia graminis f. sp. tritici]|uniref:Uncharacterized protein n=1 Tax=Puccinia graminis f. sp. tritici TaxID=56615 RepID=A0A5B0N1W3_PUCGR|nr:hypothetical protein PGT21_002680 [Puccinia graminis f. sp. tritici]